MTRLYLSASRGQPGGLAKSLPGPDGKGFVICERATQWTTPLRPGATGKNYRVSLAAQTERDEDKVAADLLLKRGAAEIPLASVTFAVTSAPRPLVTDLVGTDQPTQGGDLLVLRIRSLHGRSCLNFFQDSDVERMFIDTTAPAD